MHFLRLGALALTAALLPAGLALAAPDSLTIQMKALNGSTEDGTAVLTQEANGVRVTISLKNAPKDTPQPTHIHVGTCGNINAAPEYPLENTVDGKGTSLVKGVKLSDLTAGKFAVNVHKSGDEIKTYASCGNIK